MIFSQACHMAPCSLVRTKKFNDDFVCQMLHTLLPPYFILIFYDLAFTSLFSHCSSVPTKHSNTGSLARCKQHQINMTFFHGPLLTHIYNIFINKNKNNYNDFNFLIFQHTTITSLPRYPKHT